MGKKESTVNIGGTECAAARRAQDEVGGMTNRKYAHLNHVSPATAQRDLADLAARGILQALGGGRSVRYELAD